MQSKSAKVHEELHNKDHESGNIKTQVYYVDIPCSRWPRKIHNLEDLHLLKHLEIRIWLYLLFHETQAQKVATMTLEMLGIIAIFKWQAEASRTTIDG